MIKKLLSKISLFLIDHGLPFEWVLKFKIIYDQLFDPDREYMEAFHNRWADLWKEYYRVNYDIMQQKLAALKKDLDEFSQQTVDLIFDRNVFILPRQRNNNTFLYNIKELFTPGELSERKLFRNKLKVSRRKYKMSENIYDESTFCTRCGLDLVPSAAVEKIRGKDIIDVGAFIGDSALIFNELSPRKIYAFEPEPNNFDALNKTIEINKLENKIVPVKKGIGESDTSIRLSIDRAASSGYDINDAKESIEIELTTIDKFAVSNSLEVGLIKMDIEGQELNAVRGALETIKKDRPILLIAVYHRPEDFFEIKPLLESNLSDYNYIIRKLTPYHPTYETTLIAYPDFE